MKKNFIFQILFQFGSKVYGLRYLNKYRNDLRRGDITVF